MGRNKRKFLPVLILLRGRKRSGAMVDSRQMSNHSHTNPTRRQMLKIAGISATAAVALFAGAQDFTLVNKTGFTIASLYISPADADNWGEDILGRDTLPTDNSVNIHFNRQEKAALWDLRVEDADGDSYTWENFNLLKISAITIFYSKEKGATAEYQ